MIPPEDCLAHVSGSCDVEGMDGGKIKITRDRFGIPHIMATSAYDVYFGQGFCIAQERMFQLEYQRLMSHGRLAELLGPGLLRRDKRNRRMGYLRLAQLDWEAQTKDAKLILNAYSGGINAALASQPQAYEFRQLGGHQPQKWKPVDSLAVLKMVSDTGQWAVKRDHGVLLQALGPHALNAVLPDSPRGTSVHVPPGAEWTAERSEYHLDDDSLGEVGYQNSCSGAGGSNCWVVSGKLSASGKPMVAGDPHLGLQVPGQWYVMTAECSEFKIAGPINPVGLRVFFACSSRVHCLSFRQKCYPGPIFYGHNSVCAWTMTHAQGDRFDVYRERVRRRGFARGGHSHSGKQPTFEALSPTGDWLPLTEHTEQFLFRDVVTDSQQSDNGSSQLLQRAEDEVVYTTQGGHVSGHGVVMFGIPTKAASEGCEGCSAEEMEVLAVRWGLGSSPCHDIEAMRLMHLARSAEELRVGLRTFDSISGNYCFAAPAAAGINVGAAGAGAAAAIPTNAGSSAAAIGEASEVTSEVIGYQYTGRIPKRPAYLVPMPGWTGEHEWETDAVPKVSGLLWCTKCPYAIPIRTTVSSLSTLGS
jgi:hypothetical protein